MSTSPQADDRDRIPAHELRRMDEETARSTLTVNQYERWEKLNDLHAEAAETKEQWADEAERVAEITVSADMEQLGTEVDVFGNDLLVYVDSDDEEVQAIGEDLERIQAKHDDVPAEEIETIPAEDREEMARVLCRLLDAILVRWDGVEWADLPEWKRETVLEDARDGWDLDGLLLAWVDIAVAINEDREETMDVIESFRSSERRGRR